MTVVVLIVASGKTRAIVPGPTYLGYAQALDALGIPLVSMPTEERSAFSVDFQALGAALSGDELVFLGHPNNPTGTYNTADEFADFMKRVPENVIVLTDEAYYEYVTVEDYPQTVPMLAEYPNLVVNRTFSKIHSLAGLRVGYALGHPGLIGQMHKTREPFNVNSLAQAAAVAVLKEDAATALRAEHNRQWREELSEGLAELGLEVTPSQTNFVLVRCPGDAGELVQKLLRLGVIVRPMNAFGLGDGSLRVSVGLPEENRRCLDALKEILA